MGEYTINEKIGWQAGFYTAYQSGIPDGYNKLSSNYKSGIDMSSSFFNNRLRCNISINDLFNAENRNSNTTIGNVKYQTKNIPDSRYIRLSISYSFSSKTVEKYYSHGIQNEEKNRIK